MKKIEEVEVTRTIDQVTAILCDICGKDADRYGHDGFTFSHRPGEEDEITITALDICDECFQESDIHERIQELAIQIHKIAPYAEITLGPALAVFDDDIQENG